MVVCQLNHCVNCNDKVITTEEVVPGVQHDTVIVIFDCYTILDLMQTDSTDYIQELTPHRTPRKASSWD